MKLFNLTLLISIALVNCEEQKLGINCWSKSDCMSKENAQKSEIKKELEKCKKLKNKDDQFVCDNIALGYKKDLAEALFIYSTFLNKCKTTPDDKVKECSEKCSGDSKEECVFKCLSPWQIEVKKCLLEATPIKVDVEKSVVCSQQCSGKTLSDLYYCDAICNKELYPTLASLFYQNGGEKPKGIDGPKINSNDTKSDSSSAKKTTSAANSKPTGATETKVEFSISKTSSLTQSGTAGRSNAISNFETSALVKIAVPALLLLLTL